ncbi:ribosome biogenesis GTPase Der [Candidatus Peregrinibacteria bacterium]|nr:ribosome biogenesis GTPase Der [Candidatus Peregrinibacteria bacterium]
MARLATVAIIGRPNTGKSTLFNRLIGRRKAIVSDTPGTTRDQIAARKTGVELDYIVIDTGGIGGGSEDTDFEDDVERQSVLAVENADVIVFTVNSRDPLTKSDFTVADILRKRGRGHVPVLLVLTKCDDPEATEEVLPTFYELGMAENIIPVSADHNSGIAELESAIEEHLRKLHFVRTPESETKAPRIAIVGKPNVGKSSLVNAFMSDSERQKGAIIVSDVPGTTRDAVDTEIRYHDRDYVFTDTAGIRRRKDTEREIEAYATFRTIREIEECDLVVLVMDATETLSRQDKRIAGLAVDAGKALIILLNKVDLTNADTRELRLKEIEGYFQFCKFAPVIPVSAKTREGLLKIFDHIETAVRNRERRIATKDLNEWYRRTVYGQPMGEIGKSKHITQSDDIPPTFVVFVRDPKKVQVSQLRYLDNSIRKTFAFEGTPIRWISKAG